MVFLKQKCLDELLTFSFPGVSQSLVFVIAALFAKAETGCG